MKETSFGYNYNYEHNQYLLCSSSCIYISLYNLYICQIIFPSCTDICVTRIAIVLINKKKKYTKQTKQSIPSILNNLGNFNWSAWSKPRKSDRSCICVVWIANLFLFTIFETIPTVCYFCWGLALYPHMGKIKSGASVFTYGAGVGPWF